MKAAVYMLILNNDYPESYGHVNPYILLGKGKQVLRDYLDQNGSHIEGLPEKYCEIGYVNLVKVFLDCSESKKVWSYCFDGDETVGDAIKRAEVDVTVEFEDPAFPLVSQLHTTMIDIARYAGSLIERGEIQQVGDPIQFVHQVITLADEFTDNPQLYRSDYYGTIGMFTRRRLRELQAAEFISTEEETMG